VDIISEKDTLSGYKLVVVPAMYVLEDETASNLEYFVASGGVVVFTPRTGVKDDANAVVNMKLPGLVANLAGVEVEEYISMPVDEDSGVQFTLPGLEDEFSASVWADVLKPTTAQVIAHYSKDFYADQPAATCNLYGDGKVIYLGVMGDANFYGAIARTLSMLSDISPVLETPTGVEAAERWREDQRLLFILNHTQSGQDIQLHGKYEDLLTGKSVKETIALPPLDVTILKEI
jgi:beta-galactosidase